MSSVKNVVEESVKNAINSVCSNYSRQLSEWLQENKNVEITSEEICSLWDVPYCPPSTPGIPSGASVTTRLPEYYAGAVSPAKKRGGRTKKTVDPNAPKCQYKLTRGKKENIGKECGKPVLADGVTHGADRFCKACLGKAAVQKLLEKSEDKSTVKPPVLPGSSITVPEKEEAKTDEISVIEISGKPGWFKDTNHGFIIEQTKEGNIVAHEIENDKGETRKLNDEDRKLALDLGLQVVSEETVDESGIPKIPNVVLESN